MSTTNQKSSTIASFEQPVQAAQLVIILRALAGTRSSGLLAVQGEEDLVSLTFRHGDIVAADAMNRSMEDALCDILAHKGLLPPTEFRDIVRGDESAARLGSELLIESGKLERSVVLDAVREQIFRQSIRLLRWSNGHLQWVAGGESPFQAGVLPLSVGELLLRSIDELGAAGPLGTKEPNFDCQYVVATNAEGRFRKRQAGDPFGATDLEGAADGGEVHLLTPHELEVMRKVQGGATTQGLIPDGERQSWQVRATLHHLWSLGLLERRFQDSGRVKTLSGPPNKPAGEEQPAIEDRVAAGQADLPERQAPDQPSRSTEPGDDTLEAGIEEIHRLDLSREPSGPLLSLGDDEDELSRLLEDPPGLDGVELLGEGASQGVHDAPLDDEPLDDAVDPLAEKSLASFTEPALRERPPLASGPLQVDDVLVREIADTDAARGDFEDLYTPWKDDGPQRDPWSFVATLVNVWGVRFLAMTLVALLIRLLVGANQSDEPLRVLTEATDLDFAAQRTSWRLVEEKLEQALRVYHLLYGLYPEDLEVLVDLDLCSKDDLSGDGARRISYQLEDDGYRLQSSLGTTAPGDGGGREVREVSMQGDFLLNPQYVRDETQSGVGSAPPVVVLE